MTDRERLMFTLGRSFGEMESRPDTHNPVPKETIGKVMEFLEDYGDILPLAPDEIGWRRSSWLQSWADEAQVVVLEFQRQIDSESYRSVVVRFGTMAAVVILNLTNGAYFESLDKLGQRGFQQVVSSCWSGQLVPGLMRRLDGEL